LQVYGLPAPTIPVGSFDGVALGVQHLCAIEHGGSVLCTGNNSYGQLDAPSGAFSSLAAGGDLTCGIKTDGSLACWGANYAPLPPPPSGNFQSVAVSKNGVGLHACAIALDGQLTCWGDYPDGAAIAAIGPVRSVDAGGQRTCAVKADGSLTCFSTNPLAGVYQSVAVSGTDNFGGCALKSDQTAVCWGVAADGLPSGVKFERIAAAGDYDSLMTCGITALGRVQCWGLISRSAQ